MSDHIGRETGRHHTALFRGDHTLVLLLEEDRYSSKKESLKICNIVFLNSLTYKLIFPLIGDPVELI